MLGLGKFLLFFICAFLGIYARFFSHSPLASLSLPLLLYRGSSKYSFSFSSFYLLVWLARVQAMIFFLGPLCLVLFHCFKNPNVFYYHAIKCSLVGKLGPIDTHKASSKVFFWVTLGFSTIHFQMCGSR
jgi:hypothetical protein